MNLLVGPEVIEKAISIDKYRPLMQEIRIALQEDGNVIIFYYI